MKKKIFGLAVGLLVILACGAPTATPSVDEIVTLTLQALTAAPADAQPETAATPEPQQTTPDGESVSYGEISFLIPNGMANGATTSITTEVELPYINPSNGEMPEHIKFTLNNYTVQGAMFQPEIMVFKVSEYTQYSELNAQTIAALQANQYTDGQPLPDAFPAGNAYTVKIHGISFQNGHGIRYVTQFDQSYAPANNHQIFYNFHGITSDGTYYIQAVMPVNLPFLPEDGNPDTFLPEGGIPYDFSIPFNLEEIANYNQAISDKINTTDGFIFTPYLPHLDAMIESLLVNGF